MNEFNLIVLNIAIIVFIITLVTVGIILYHSVNTASFPPIQTVCPTYYKVDGSNNCIFDKGTYNNNPTYPSLATLPSNSCNNVPITTFYKSGFSNNEILCEKYKWAKNCNVFWDGVTNNGSACFSQKSTLFP